MGILKQKVTVNKRIGQFRGIAVSNRNKIQYSSLDPSSLP